MAVVSSIHPFLAECNTTSNAKMLLENKMRLENVVQIEAPPSVVWNVTEDIENWPRWTPTVESVTRVDSGPFDVGSVARIKQPGLPEAVWTVTELIRGERFTWETRIRGIRMKGVHEMTANSTGTISVLRIEVSGALAVILWPMIRGSAQRALDRENAGLKAKCESRT